jgi:hypothetical protein
VRNAIAYVLLNARRHAARADRVLARAIAIDPASSGRWFGRQQPVDRAGWNLDCLRDVSDAVSSDWVLTLFARDESMNQ